MSIAALHSLPAVLGVNPDGRRLRASSVEDAMAVSAEAGVDKKKLEEKRMGKEDVAKWREEAAERGLEVLYDDGFGGVTVKDYFAAARAVSKDDGGPPRWFCPVESGRPAVEKAPLLLFLPGTDGVGMGLILHHKSLGKVFEVRCFHIPVNDRTTFEARQMAYTLLSEINPTSKHWTVCARVSRLWEYRGNVDDAEIQHLDLVLVDEHGNAIYAEIPKEHVEAKRALLQEEHIYTFSRFLVSPNKAKYRPVDSDYMIEIGYYTKIEELLDATPNFLMYAYSLIPLENLGSYIGETKNFLDVIGVVKAVSNAASIQGSNQSSATTKRLVVIKDAKDCETTVTLRDLELPVSLRSIYPGSAHTI